MGIVQHWHIYLYTMCWRASGNGRSHFKGETFENGQMGGQPIGTHERGRQSKGKV